MTLRHGFKAEARRLALEVREEMGIGILAPLDPYALAELYGIEVHDLRHPSLPRAAVRHLTEVRPGAFSAALVAVGTGSVIIENHAHDPVRRRSTIAHEMAHVLLEHEFGLLLTEDETCRGGSRTVEREAAELSGELLIPCAAARVAAFRRWTDTTVARHFRVSRRMARWRMNATGARTVAQRCVDKRRNAVAAAARSRG
ncbi:Zn-dependent peptidase ImmA (M78 family) [Prauserella shujinwangii]|uniref:Zn-dependent peptidase ImmA (M78 family) n=1 Tax=Prauserella shujinwangii TaxID=1453103 RepID=A0A2T0LPS6_9PSEU|nr:ImmA/IrrE family metallo-endopeptidase [Prauserella shujinwangii]PRX45357.1 Zn-dependent peptidase ImmA (M78 family) [Prauserella shujinwangii]